MRVVDRLLSATQTVSAERWRVRAEFRKAGQAALNKELYGHIYSCRKTLRRLLTFGSQTVVRASSFAIFPPSLSVFHFFSRFLSLSFRFVSPSLSRTLSSSSVNISLRLASSRAFLAFIVFLVQLFSSYTCMCTTIFYLSAFFYHFALRFPMKQTVSFPF